MNYTILKNEILNDPSGKGYATFLPESTGKVAELLNAKTEHMIKSKMITARGIMASYGIGPVAGAAFLDKLEIVAQSVPSVKWAMKFLQQEAGIDVGESATQSMLDSLVGIAGVTAQEVQGIKAIGMQPSSRVEIILGADKYASEQDVIIALGN